MEIRGRGRERGRGGFDSGRFRPGTTYTQIHIQVVFTVAGRQSLIKPEHNDELQKYITGIVSGQKQKLMAINNMPDHLHLPGGMKPDWSRSDLRRDVKAGPSKFINEKHWVKGRFSWQEGFGAFSHSRSQPGAVIRYIENQQKHHPKSAVELPQKGTSSTKQMRRVKETFR